MIDSSNINMENVVEKNQPEPDALELAHSIYSFLDEKKAENIKVLNLERVNPYFCYFLIASAGSSTQLKSLSREIQKRFGRYLHGKSGAFTVDDLASGWVVLDFIDLVVHIFLPEQRAYYNLEKLWGDANEIVFEQKSSS